MKIVRAACIVIICAVSLYLLFLPIAYLVDPFESFEKTSWLLVPVVSSYILLALGAIGVLKHRTFAWWGCQLLLLGNVTAWVLSGNLVFASVFLVLLIMFVASPPWRWENRTAGA